MKKGKWLQWLICLEKGVLSVGWKPTDPMAAWNRANVGWDDSFYADDCIYTPKCGSNRRSEKWQKVAYPVKKNSVMRISYGLEY